MPCMPSVLMRSALVAVLGLAGAPVVAAPFTVLSEDEVYDVSADGSFVVDGRLSRRIDEQQAVMQAGQFALPFSESMQKLEIIEAYTTTKDGTRIDVPADKIISQQLPASAGAPTFSDYKLKSVIFPQVEVGAVLTLHYSITQLKPMLPGVFSVHNLFSRFVEYKGATMTVRAPEKLTLYVSAQGVTGGEVKATKPGTREWHWTYAGATPLIAEPGSVSAEDFSPGITVSTMKDYPALAAAYMIGAAPAAKVTPAVQKLADEITQGVAGTGAGKRAQAEAIYRWVSANIRYVALFMGAGGYVPHTADEIISVRYGDCKDKTTLMTALLGAKGIRSAPVLVNASNRYTLPDTPVISAFNHAITWLPDFNLFVDSTSGFAGFGVLPDGLMGKRALIAGGVDLKPVLTTLPVSSPATDTIVLRTVATLAADGTVTGTNRIQATGIYEPLFRATLGSIPPAQLALVGPRLLSNAGQAGEATLTIGDMRDLTKPVSMEAQFKVPSRVALPGPGALTGVYGIRPPGDLGALVGFIMQQERKLDFPCLSGSFDEQVELTLPPDFKISNLPHPAKIDTALVGYASSYTQQDHKLVITRRLEAKYPHVVCTNADSIELRKFAAIVGQDLRAQVLYQ
jgi:transglutaminase-like putative cysteine protease